MTREQVKKIGNHLGDILLRSGYTRRESLDILRAIGKLIEEIENEQQHSKEDS
jgi:hypothetical protein